MDHKQRILLKGEELFLHYGIRSVSMDDIAVNLGMSKKTLYQYYADKDELVAAVVDLHINKMEKDCAACRRSAKDAIHEMFLTMTDTMEQFKAFQRFREHKDKYLYKVIKDNIEWGMKDGVYREELQVEILIRYRLETMMLPFNIMAFPPSKFTVLETNRVMMENFILGLCSSKGIKLIQKYNQQRIKKQSHENR